MKLHCQMIASTQFQYLVSEVYFEANKSLHTTPPSLVSLPGKQMKPDPWGTGGFDGMTQVKFKDRVRTVDRKSEPMLQQTENLLCVFSKCSTKSVYSS